MPTLLLASSSPYRRALLTRLGLEFNWEAPDIDESQRENETADSLVTRLSLAKAKALAGSHPNSLIIGSDQVAVLDNRILGKPHTHERARIQLQNASGRQVLFKTGLCLLNSATGKSQVAVVDFSVFFRELSNAQIDAYLNREKPYDCAGSFKAEGLGICLFSKLCGDDPNSLIGLPLITLTKMLASEDVDPLFP
ncbi:MAG TPA: Maf family nucleotide pyrophosphatase [Cellvibrio sp.]|nr:Maf family nucleotide pyrophosphatase [Cellvibrio sp.]